MIRVNNKIIIELTKAIKLNELNKYEEAIKCFYKVIEIDPNDKNSWYGKGISLDELKKYKEAIECFNKAIKIDSDFKGT